MVNITFTPERVPITTVGGKVYYYESGDIAWVTSAACLVFIMTPGVGFLYSGLLRHKNALSMVWLSVAVLAVVTVQWFLFGYSLAFSPTASKFIGNFKNFGLIDCLDEPSPLQPRLPSIAVALYQLMFATITPIIAVGAAAERGRLAPVLVFTFVWSTLVYDVVACWSWNPAGWAYQMGSLDFAGGGVVHTTSGVAAAAYSIWLGRRQGYGTEKLAYRPSNITHVILGTVFLWFGWFGFNGGSALASNLRSLQASFVTNLAASSAGLTWVFLDLRFDGKWSSVGFCSGVVAGLIAITPASGFVGSPAGFAIGIAAGSVCNIATRIKVWLGFDDCLDIFATHAVGGFLGCILTGIFADKRVAGIDGVTDIPGGWINRNWVQVPKQLAYEAAIVGYTFFVTSAILLIMDLIPGLTLRASTSAEEAGIDAHQMNEFATDFTGEFSHSVAPLSTGGAAVINTQRPVTSMPSWGAESQPYISKEWKGTMVPRLPISGELPPSARNFDKD